MEEAYTILNIIWEATKNWWWAILPFVLWRPFLFLWLWWRREIWSSKQKAMMLEVKIPRDVLKPIKAMEQVMASIWGAVFDPPDWWEKWIEGKMQISISFDIVSLGGETHLYLRILDVLRNTIESCIYAEYPDAEISVVDDYTKNVPRDIPNNDWDMWGANIKLLRDDVFPIRTYASFFEERTEAKEEKRIDPLATLFEGLGRLVPGEQMWIQIIASPVTNVENNYVDRGKEKVGKMLSRKKAEKPKSIVHEATEGLLFGPQEKKKEEPAFLAELQLSPGEREIVSSMEKKIGSYVFETVMRFIYLGKKDVFFKPQIKSAFAFFAQFDTANLNGFKPWPETITKIKKKWFLPLNLFIARRLYLRKRHLFRNYIKRFPPFWPKSDGPFILSIEEMATIFHFPGQMSAPAPSVQRVEAKKGEAPASLPVE
jgi:hypothetical protein